MNSDESGDDPRHATVYEIRLRGHLGRHWTDQLGGLDISWTGDGDTLLAGPIADQPALHGLLRRLRDLGVTLISINTKEDESMASIMQSASATASRRDRKMVLSTLWIFALINYIYADIFNLFFMPPGSTTMSDGTLVAFAVLMETAIAMVLLPRILRHAWNRWLNVIVGVLQIAFLAYSLIGSTPRPFYYIFVCIEMATVLFIAIYAGTWKKEQALAA